MKILLARKVCQRKSSVERKVCEWRKVPSEEVCKWRKVPSEKSSTRKVCGSWNLFERKVWIGVKFSRGKLRVCGEICENSIGEKFASGEIRSEETFCDSGKVLFGGEVCTWEIFEWESLWVEESLNPNKIQSRKKFGERKFVNGEVFIRQKVWEWHKVSFVREKVLFGRKFGSEKFSRENLCEWREASFVSGKTSVGKKFDENKFIRLKVWWGEYFEWTNLLGKVLSVNNIFESEKIRWRRNYRIENLRVRESFAREKKVLRGRSLWRKFIPK